MAAVQKIADKNEKIEVNTIEQTIKNIQYRYSASINALYMTSAILFVFGSISLVNMLMVRFQNRKREIGLLEAVGTTRQQLKAMLDREIRNLPRRFVGNSSCIWKHFKCNCL